MKAAKTLMGSDEAIENVDRAIKSMTGKMLIFWISVSQPMFRGPNIIKKKKKK